ncbi:MAG: hypothetical protein WC444_04855 [Candidatus Paceibacterota bacterium]
MTYPHQEDRMIQSSLKYEAHGCSTSMPDGHNNDSNVTYTAVYVNNEPDDCAKEDEFEGMLFSAWESNYWWRDCAKDDCFSVEMPVLPLIEKKVWTFNHSGVRPWTGKNFHKSVH